MDITICTYTIVMLITNATTRTYNNEPSYNTYTYTYTYTKETYENAIYKQQRLLQHAL